ATSLRPEIIAARAVAPLPRLLELSAPWLGPGVRALFMKGRDAGKEIESAKRRFNFTFHLHPSMTADGSFLLEIGGPFQPHKGEDAMSPTGPRRTRVIALANQKGGVGKTTTAINLGTALAAIGERVMIVDLDPQGNASTGLGIDERHHSTSDVLTGKVPFAAARVETNVPTLSVVPATIDLMAFERESMSATGRHYRLRDAIALMLAAEDPDKTTTYILIDCPPSLNLLTVSALAAADAVLVPLQCEFFALE